MHRRISPPARLLSLAEEQGGVVSREQCLSLGLTEAVLRRLSRSDWDRTAPGVYRVFPAADRWVGDAWTGVLALALQIRGWVTTLKNS